MEKLDQKMLQKRPSIPQGHSQPSWSSPPITFDPIWGGLRNGKKGFKRRFAVGGGWTPIPWLDGVRGKLQIDRFWWGFGWCECWFFNVWEKAIWKRLKTEKKSLSWNLGEWIQKWSTPYARHEIFWILKPVEYLGIPRVYLLDFWAPTVSIYRWWQLKYVQNVHPENFG